MLWGRDFPCTVPPSNTPEKPRISLYAPCFEGKAHNYHPAQKEKFIRQNPCLYPAKKEEAYSPKYSPAIKESPYLALTSWCFAVRLLRFCILPFPLRGRGICIWIEKKEGRKEIINYISISSSSETLRTFVPLKRSLYCSG